MVLNFEFFLKNAVFIAQGLGVTLLLSVLGIVLAVILAQLLVGLEKAVPVFSTFTSLYISLIGGTPLLLQIFFVFLVLPQLGIIIPGLWAGVIVLGLHYGTRISEFLRADFSFLGKGQQATWQFMPPVVITELTSMVKDSALVAVTGIAQDVMWRAIRVGRGEFRNLEPLLMAAMLYWVVTLILSAIRKSVSAGSQPFQFSGASLKLFPSGRMPIESHGGFPMGPDEITRLCCANAVTASSFFRRSILNQLRDKHKAVALEVGLNVRTVAQVCVYMEKRELKYQVWFTLLGIGALFLWQVDPRASLIPLLASVVLWFYKKHQEHFVLTPYFAKERFNESDIARAFRTDLDHDLLDGLPTEDHNLIIYEEFLPFVGTGIDMGGWMFAINVTRPKKQGEEAMPVNISELYGALNEGGKKLLLPGLQIKDLLFVHGTAIRRNPDILSDPFGRPMQCLSHDLVKQFMGGNDFQIRHYKWFVVHDWGNEMVFSLFLRCALRGPNLFVEVNRFLLTPLADQYHQIDALPAKNWQFTLALAGSSLLLGPGSMVVSMLMLLLHGLGWLEKALGLQERIIKREIKKNPLFNYGVSTSLRQTMSSLRFSNYFQKLDREMYVRVLDREILDSIVAFLDEHNVDTSDLKSQQAAILNSGIIIQGGNLEAQSVAVGEGSQALTTAKPVKQSKPAKKE